MRRPAADTGIVFRPLKSSQSGVESSLETFPPLEFLFSDSEWKLGGDRSADQRSGNCLILCSVPQGQLRAVHNASEHSGSVLDIDDPARRNLYGAVRAREEVRAVFDEIDIDRDGSISEEDCRAYALKHHLPTTYVREFLDQARYGWKSVQFPWGAAAGRKGGRGFRWPFRIRRFFSLSSPPVNYDVFSKFLDDKDEAIHATFQRMDSDGDGHIGLWELEKGLERYPVRRSCLAKMMARASKGRGGEVSFQDFRHFFTLLPTCDSLMEFWVTASCCPPGLDTRTLHPHPIHPPPHLRSKARHWNHLVAGGLAGAFSRTATAPLETMRLRMMTSQQESLARAVQHTLASPAGWRGLFKGNLANVVRSAPQKAIDFFAFEAYKSALPVGSVWGTVLAGALAGATSTVFLYPMEVVRFRLTTTERYRGILDAWCRIAEVEGAGALYKGLRPSVISILPEAAITYGCFDLLKSAYKRFHGQESIGVMPALVCGVSAAFTGQLVAYPLELVARRSQVGGSDNILMVLRSTVRTEGWQGLYRGIVPASAKVIPMACVSFAVYESVRAAMQWAEAWEKRREVECVRLEEEEGLRLSVRGGRSAGMERQGGSTWA